MNSGMHIKLDYLDSINSKKQMLLCEKNILEIVKHMRTYNSLKKTENSIKLKLKNNFEHLKKLVESIKEKMPQDLAMPKSEKHEKVKALIKMQPKSDLERQLEDIQAKLARLQ